MFLTDEQIRSITRGAVSVKREQDGVHFCRLTKEQFAVYDDQPLKHPRRTATAGIRFMFRTDSRYISMAANLRGNGGTGAYFSFDVFVNGKRKTCWDNFSHMQLPRQFTGLKFQLDVPPARMDLGEGTKEVVIHFPWNRPVVLHWVEIEDGAFIEPIKPEKKLIAFGDSITQGFYALRPSDCYISRIADALGAELYNKGIGGERYVPAMVETPDAFTPDYVVVAYGTNDWRNSKREEFETKCKDFYEKLYKLYPTAKIFAITPIWRSNLDENTQFDSIYDIRNYVEKITANMPNVTVIDGMELVPHTIDYFADEGLHPNDFGFDHYYRNLLVKLKPYL